MQRLNQIWIALLIVSLGFTLFFGGVGLIKVWKFFRFDQQCPAVVSRFEVVPLASCRFAVAAYYDFEVDGTLYEGKTVFETPQCLSQFAAEHAMVLMKGKTWRVSYRQANPALSTLEKKFPYKACLEASVTLGVFAYFCFSRRIIEKFRECS